MFYDRFALICSNKGIAETTAAKEIGLDRSAVTRWKNGATPKNETIKKIADYFDVSPEYLMGKRNLPFTSGLIVANETRWTPVDEVRSIIDDIESMHKKPELRMLLSAASKLSKQDVEAITAIAKRMYTGCDDES